MAHELELINGEAQMFSVKETPWHGLGRIIHEAPSVEEGIRLAGLDWQVELRELRYSLDQDRGNDRAVRHKAVIRESDQSCLGVVGPGYRPLQNREAFDFFNPFIQAGQCTLETAGSLREGRRVWVLAKLNRDPIEVVKGDAVEKFLMLSNSHDGSTSVRVGFTPIRVVCANTLAMAHGNKSSALIRVSHTRGVAESLEKIGEIMDAANARFEATAEQYRALALRDISEAELNKYVKLAFAEKLAHTADSRKQEVADKITWDIVRFFETGRGSQLPGVRGTYWAAYNAVTEHLSYEASTSQDRRLNELWFGDLEKQNRLALKAAVEMAAA